MIGHALLSLCHIFIFSQTMKTQGKELSKVIRVESVRFAMPCFCNTKYILYNEKVKRISIFKICKYDCDHRTPSVAQLVRKSVDTGFEPTCRQDLNWQYY